MKPKYKESSQVPDSVLIARLKELANAVTEGRDAINREFFMSVPAQLDKDADLVLMEAAIRLRLLSKERVK